MARDITETRREKVAAYLLEAGGERPLADLHEWSSLKLLCAHQAFSQLMEGMVDDGLVRWDGTRFTLTDDGHALGEAARAAPKRKGAVAAAVEPAAAAGPDHDHGGHDHGGHDHGGDHDHGGHDHDHGGGHDHGGHDHGGHDHGGHDHGGHDHGGHDHDHGGDRDHGHSHQHDRYGDGREVELPKAKPRRAASPPPPPPAPEPRGGLRATVKGLVKGLLGRKG